MVVLHVLIHSSRVHQDFVGGVQVSFLLASRSAINSPYSFELEFCISSFFLDIQIRSILPSKFFSFNYFNSFRRFCVMSSSIIIPSSQVCVLFFPCSAGVLPKSFQSYSFLISFYPEWFLSLSDSVSFCFSSFSSFLSSSRVLSILCFFS